VSIFSAASHRVSRKPGNCPGEKQLHIVAFALRQTYSIWRAK
jgi:hypothetical protein